MSIYKDSFFEGILSKLNGSLDTDLFEKCCVDILRKNDYPTLVPIPGGQDSGMDGAISDMGEEPIPLVITTNKSPITNLNKNLTQYKKDGGKRREAVLATSVKLTARKIKNLRDKANTLGFSLIQIYEQEAIAMRLYHEPSWCRSLLGISGKPKTLSKIPKNSRSVVNKELIGRDAEKEELFKAIDEKRDLLLIGQPGIGKTYLLNEVVSNTNSFFLNGSDIEGISNDIRELRPDIIIIDDAQVKSDLLKDLLHFRKENTIPFNIFCVSWPSYKDHLIEELSITEDECIELQLLSRNNIVKVVNDCGIERPKNLIWHIVNQSSGKPGLAAMLSKVCLSGGINEFISGKALKRVLLSSLEKHFGKEITQVLAYFAFLGEYGATIQGVSNWSGIERLKLNRQVSELALIGILKEQREKRLSVIPKDLSYILVQDNFFNGAFSLESDQFFELAKSNSSIVKVLIGVLSKNGEVDENKLYDLIKMNPLKDVLNMYAGLGREQTLKLLADFQDKINDYLHIALHYAPKETVPILIDLAIKNPKENLHSLPGHPARRLQDWVSEIRNEVSQVVSSKETVLKGILDRLQGDEADKILYEILPHIFSCSWSGRESDPGNGLTITISDGYFSKEVIIETTKLWTNLREKLSTIRIIGWTSLLKILNQFAYPYAPRQAPPDEIKKASKKFARQLVDDLIKLASSHPGILSEIKKVCKDLKIRKEIVIKEPFETLFPIERYGKDYERKDKQNAKKVELLIKEKAQLTPTDVLTELKEMTQFAKDIDKTYPDLTYYYSNLLAKNVNNPIEWFKVATQTNLPASLTSPFIYYVIEDLTPDLEDALISLLDSEYFWIISSHILINSKSSVLLVQEVLSRLNKDYSQAIETLFYQNIPSSTAQLLLTHQCRDIREASAIGEWLKGGEERGQVRDELRPDWENAVVESKDEEYWLSRILQEDSELSFRWIQERVNEEDYLSYNERGTFSSAMNVLEKHHKIKLISLLKKHYSSLDKVKSLVGYDIDCFKELLANEDLKDLHLFPLEKKTGQSLVDFSEAALSSGYSIEDIADAVRSRNEGWSGKESDMLLGKINSFKETLKLTSNDEITSIINLVIDSLQKRREWALKSEHEEEVYGRY